MSVSAGLLKDKVCLITGTSRGIGQEIAERFAGEGAIVYANARTEGSLAEWADRLNQDVSGKIIPLYFDVTDSAGIKEAVMRIKKEQGKIDVLVNNAGIIHNEMLGMVSKEKMREMFEVNVFGLVDLTQMVATRFMTRQKSGSIINIASIVGVEGSRGQMSYSASKGAVIALTKSMAMELAPHGVRVNAVAPGMIKTERLEATVKEEYKDLPMGMGRLGSVREVADACVYFAADHSSYTTGQIVVLNGGYSTASRAMFHIEHK